MPIPYISVKNFKKKNAWHPCKWSDQVPDLTDLTSIRLKSIMVTWPSELKLGTVTQAEAAYSVKVYWLQGKPGSWFGLLVGKHC